MSQLDIFILNLPISDVLNCNTLSHLDANHVKKDYVLIYITVPTCNIENLYLFILYDANYEM